MGDSNGQPVCESMVVHRPRSQAHWASGMRYYQSFDTSLSFWPPAERYSPPPPWWHVKKTTTDWPSCKILALQQHYVYLQLYIKQDNVCRKHTLNLLRSTAVDIELELCRTDFQNCFCAEYRLIGQTLNRQSAKKTNNYRSLQWDTQYICPWIDTSAHTEIYHCVTTRQKPQHYDGDSSRH